MLAGCLPGSVSRPRVDTTDEELDGGATEEFPGCLNFYDSTTLSCVDACPEFTYDADPSSSSDLKEINKFLDEDLLDKNLSDTEIAEIRTQVGNSRMVCLKVERPDDAITIKGSICACKDGKSDIINDCDAFCATKSTSTEATLYGSVSLDAVVEGFDGLGNLYNWCNKTIDDGLVSPSCRLIAEDEDGVKNTLNITIPEGSNTFTVNIGTLAFDKTYILRIKEVGSGSLAQTRAVQIRRIQRSTDLAIPTGPLRLMPINQYTCYNRSIALDSPDYFINGIIYQHFYYPSNEDPLPMSPDSLNIICHDVNSYGQYDNPLFPRLMTVSGHFALWDRTDPRFFDQDQNGVRDIEDLMKKNIQDQFGQNITVTGIFKGLVRSTSPNSSGNLGYFMTTWSDPQTGDVFCPNQSHYNGNDAIFRVMKDLIGVETEAIYAAIKEEEAFIDPATGTVTKVDPSFMMIRESQLKKIWFYFENGQHYTPDEQTAKQKTIRYYWPPDPDNPYIKKASQRIYTILDPSTAQINGSSADDGSTISTSVLPPDKRFGCIPAISD